MNKKNLFNFNLSNSSSEKGSYAQETCEPCSSECERIKKKINNKRLSEIQKDDIDHVISVFGTRR